MVQLTKDCRSVVEKFLEDIDPQDTVVWLTYNVSASRLGDVLGCCDSRKKQVICWRRKDRSTTYAVHVDQSSKLALQAAKWELRCAPGVHAKGIFVLKDGQKLSHALLGSFNLSWRAIAGKEQWESLIEVKGPELLEELQKALQEIIGSAEDVEDRFLRSPTGEGPSAGDRERAMLGPEDEKTLEESLEELQDMLSKWPEEEPRSGFQEEIFKSMWKESDAVLEKEKLGYDRWLLHLPVGLGKTYIALAYALRAVLERDRSPTILYLTPNSRVSTSVKDVVVKVGLERFVTVSHPQGVSECGRAVESFGVVILDEVHNWNARESDESTEATPELDNKSTYDPVASRALRVNADGETTVLGLSGTPCRLYPEDEQVNGMLETPTDDVYSVPAFIERFLVYPARAPATGEPSKGVVQGFVETLRCPPADISLSREIGEDGLLAQVEWRELNGDMHSWLDRLLSRRDVAVGHWSNARLGKSWLAAVEEGGGVHKLAESILEAMGDKGCGIVFLPVKQPAARKELAGFLNLLRVECFDMTDDSGQPTGDYTRVVDDFKKSEASKKLLLAINRVSEGLSIPEIDMLFMLRPTRSPLISVQQLGRGVRRGTGPERKKLQVYDLAQTEKMLEEWERHLRKEPPEAGISERRNRTTAPEPLPSVEEVERIAAKALSESKRVRSEVEQGIATRPTSLSLEQILKLAEQARDRFPTKLCFSYNQATYWLVLKEDRKFVEYRPKDSGRKRAYYSHERVGRRWKLQPKNRNDFWPIEVRCENGAWEVRVVDEEPRWVECTELT